MQWSRSDGGSVPEFKDRILETLATDGPGTALDIAYRIGGDDRWIPQLLTRLVADGAVEYSEIPTKRAGRRPRLYRLTSSAAAPSTGTTKTVGPEPSAGVTAATPEPN